MGLDHVDLAGDRPALASAWAITRCWEGPLGAVSPLLGAVLVHGAAPHKRQHLMAVALRIGETLQQQHAHALGEAGAVRRIAKDLQRPSGARPRWRENSTNTPGVASTVTPPASASEHSPERNA